LVSAAPLQAFAAGAALSATSLGTTFTILSTTQLITTRLGTVTTAAAMLDDVVGLVMVQIISNLGGSGSSSSSFSAVTVIRPLFVSIGFALFAFLLCSFCLGPLLRKMLEARCRLPSFTRTEQFAFVVHTCVLVGIIAAATYAGTSSLFAAYLAGTIISWFDASIVDSLKTRLASATSQEQASHQTESLENSNEQSPSLELPPNQRASVSQIPTGEIIYEKYFKEPVHRILIPLFFVSHHLLQLMIVELPADFS
jgi:Kef-type K+ transport system membrane component KefB